MPKQYLTSQACYLRLKGAEAGDPVFIEEGVKVGEDTAFDFVGPPSIGMQPITDEAIEAHEEMLQANAGGPPLIKETAAPKEGGAAPFDPASPDKNSDAEKAKAAEEKKRLEAEALKNKK